MKGIHNRTTSYTTGDMLHTNTQQNSNSKLFKSLLNNNSTSIEMTYNKNITYEKSLKVTDKQKTDGILASYIRTNRTSIADDSTNKEEVSDEKNSSAIKISSSKENEISSEDEKLFKDITKDNYLSYEEISNLSYEQVLQIKDFVMQKDEDNNYIQNSFMECDRKAGILLGTTAISDNDTFNKAIFITAKKIDDEKMFETFIYDITGTQMSDKLMAHPEFQKIDYMKNDVKEYLSEIIANYKVKLNNAPNQETKELCPNMIEIFQKLTKKYKFLRENDVSPENKKLFKSITEDTYVSYEETKNLSYEQVLQIKDFLIKKDKNENYIPSTFMPHDKKAGMLLGTVAISDNDTFNKAIFNIAKKIDDEKIFETFMYDMTGTQFSDKLMAYPALQEIDYSKLDLKEYLSKKIASYQVKLDTATDDESKEFYQNMINKFKGLTNHYKSLQGESLYDDTDPFENIRALVEDLISVIKTGFTVEELEYIEQLIAELRKLLKERDDQEAATFNDEINQQIKAIEDALLALEKRMHGVAIIEMEGETTQQPENNDSDTPPSDGFHFEERLDAIEKRIDVMKNGDLKLPTDTSTRDDEEKEEEKEW